MKSYDVHCDCGEWSGERCMWEGPIEKTVVIEWIPEYLRDTVKAAGGDIFAGVWPDSPAERARVEQSCADWILETDGEWAHIVKPRRKGGLR